MRLQVLGYESHARFPTSFFVFLLRVSLRRNVRLDEVLRPKFVDGEAEFATSCAYEWVCEVLFFQ